MRASKVLKPKEDLQGSLLVLKIEHTFFKAFVGNVF